MRKKAIRRVLSILILTMLVNSMAFTGKVTATSNYDKIHFEYANKVQALISDPKVDIALGARVTASSTLGPDPVSVVVDGITTGGDNLWVGGEACDGQVQTIDIDLGRYYYIDQWKVKGAKHLLGPKFVPRDYELSYIDRYGRWYTIDSVRNNEAGTSVGTLLNTIIARYLRITFTRGCIQSNRVPVTEIGLYNSRGYIPIAGDILTTESSTPDHSAIVCSENYAIEASGKPSNGEANEVVQTTMDKWFHPTSGYKQVTVLRVKDATSKMSQGARNYALSVLGYPYNYNLLDYKDTSSFYCNSLIYRCWRDNGVKRVNLDSDVWFPPLTVSDLKDDNDVYIAYNRYFGFGDSKIVW